MMHRRKFAEHPEVQTAGQDAWQLAYDAAIASGDSPEVARAKGADARNLAKAAKADELLLG